MEQGIASRWKSSQTMTSGRFEINWYRDKDFKTVQMHSHDFCELYYFIRGSASYIVENGHFALQGGDILLISPNNLHQVNIKDSSASYERIVLWINSKYLKKLSTPSTDLSACFKISDETGGYLVRNGAVSEKVKTELLELYENSAKKGYGDDIAAETHLKTALTELGRFFLEPSQSARRAEQNELVTKAVKYINDNISGDLSLDAIAATLFVSKYYLAHLFKDETNTSPHSYVLKKRLVLSKQLIERGLAVTEVYARCGFSDYTHFFRAFKAEYGITPKQYYSFISN